MNGFAAVLRVVICFLILTDLMKVLLSFVWLKFSSFGLSCDGWKKDRRAYARVCPGIPRYYRKRIKQLRLGMPRVASALSSNDHRYFTRSYIFIRYILCVLLGASCMIWFFACFILCFKSWSLAEHTYLGEPKLCHDLLELLSLLHLNLLWAMDLL